MECWVDTAVRVWSVRLSHVLGHDTIRWDGPIPLDTAFPLQTVLRELASAILQQGLIQLIEQSSCSIFCH